MDFALSQEQEGIQSLAAKIFADRVSADELPDFDTPQDWFDSELWKELGKAGLLATALPESVGGSGMGFTELCILFEEAGRVLAPVPLVPCLAMAALPIARFGDSHQQNRALRPVATGKSVLTAALHDSDATTLLEPTTRATSDGDGWRLDGTKEFVPSAAYSDLVLVSATVAHGDQVALFLVSPDAPGIDLKPQATTTGELEYRMTFTSVSVHSNDRIGPREDGREMLRWLLNHATTALCATEIGIADRALRMTAAYTSERKQFGKPIATFQAVAQRAADAFIDLEAMKAVTQQAIWRLSAGLAAQREVSIAKFWAAEGGHRVCYAAQHLHGGIGVDTDYPLHHYYLRSRQLELTLGGTHTHLAALGDRLAQRGPTIR